MRCKKINLIDRIREYKLYLANSKHLLKYSFVQSLPHIKKKFMKLTEGTKCYENFSFSQKDVDTFIAVTGDSNPIHYDAAYASTTIFGKPIVHGMLSSSIISKLIGTKLPGPGSIYISQELKFLRPVFIDVTFKAEVEILDINEDKIQLRTSITESESNKMVLSGKALVKFKVN